MKVYASDYDGTIRVDGAVSIRNIEALKKWKALGNKFGIVTGRSVESSLLEIEKYGYELDFLVCNNGGVIYDAHMNQLKLCLIHYEKAMELIKEIRGMDCNSFVLNNGVNRAKEIVNSTYEDYKYGSYSPDYSVERIIEEKRIAQIVISLNDDELGASIAAYINEKYHGYMCAFPNVNCVDIVPVGVDKGAAVQFVCSHFGYDKDQVYVTGDAYNDLPMLRNFKSATLTHAYADIKEEIEVVVDEIADYLEMIEKQ